MNKNREESKDPEIDIPIDSNMFDLFCIELESQCSILNQGIIALEQSSNSGETVTTLELLMRAAHSIKGAAKVVALNPIIQLAHAMEDCFVAAQQRHIEINVEKIDVLLQSTDLLNHLSKIPLEEINRWMREQIPLIEILINSITFSSEGYFTPSPLLSLKDNRKTQRGSIETGEMLSLEAKKSFSNRSISQDRVLRVTAQSLNRLMALAGESLIESRWLYPFDAGLQNIRKQHYELALKLDELRECLRNYQANEDIQHRLTDLQHTLNECRYQLAEKGGELDSFIRRYGNLSDRLYQEVIDSRMRPFSDLIEAFPRMVRDMAHQLKKKVKLEIEGRSAPVDRDILEKLEMPLSHLLRNAVDHGIESPEERITKGKPPEGTIKLKAHHRGGMLMITILDDGRGVDTAQLRKKVIEKNLANAELVNRLTESELLDFLFLPSFSTTTQVTEISGRGMGLNIVQSTIQEIGGMIRITNSSEQGLEFDLQLPLTLSVIRTLLVEISGEPYAFPLARIEQALMINREQIEVVGNRQFFHYEGLNVGLVSAWQVLELEEPQLNLQQLPVVILGDLSHFYGLVVDRLIGEKELVVHDLSGKFGKISDVLAGALMEDGNPVLIIDIEDMIRSIDKLLAGDQLTYLAYEKEQRVQIKYKRILIVDDSITVREVECRLLQNQGYEVETAVNGIDGWNALRISHYDLVITDVDMPRMNGIELVRAIKNNPKLKELPVMIVSYKESEEDRIKGLEAGANYYLTKSSFHDATLVDAVQDLIGKA